MKSLLIRTLTGILFISIVILSILFSGKVLFNVFLLFSCIALFEYRTLLVQKGINLSFFFYITALLVYFLISNTKIRSIITGEMLLLLIVVVFFLLFIVELFRKKENPFTNIGYSVTGIIWIVVPFSLINTIPSMLSQGGEYFLLSLFIFVWLYDTMAYCIGSLAGRHRLMERISPRKSWEGAIGGTILLVGLSFFMHRIFTVLSLSVIQWIILAFMVAVVATVGDLVESLFKRQLLVKDSGFILPGHGGILDRFDSILFVIPFASLYLILIK